MRTTKFLAAAALCAVVVLGSAGCSGRIGDAGAILNNGYAVNTVVVEVDGRDVTCVVARGGSSTGGLAIDCGLN